MRCPSCRDFLRKPPPNSGFVSFQIDNNEFIRRDISRAVSFIEQVRNTFRELGYISCEISLFTSAYDNDPRPLAIIPIVKNWFRLLYLSCPYLLLFIPFHDVVLHLGIITEVEPINATDYKLKEDSFPFMIFSGACDAAEKECYEIVGRKEDEAKFLIDDFYKKIQRAFGKEA